MTQDTPLPFSQKLAVNTITSAGKSMILTPDADVRAEIARFLDIAAIDALEADFQLEQWQRNGVRLSGTLHATVTLTCVVSSQQFPFTVSEPVEVLFAEEGANAHDSTLSVEELMADDGEIIDPIENGMIDVGHVVTEFLALGLPAFPRKSDAELPARYSPEESAETKRPFAALAELAKKMEKK